MQIIDERYNVPLRNMNAKCDEAVLDGALDAEQPSENTVVVSSTQQSHVLQQLELLRTDLPALPLQDHKGRGGGRRDYRRWLTPDHVTVELYDDKRWHTVETLDCGIPGVRVIGLPEFVGNGPMVVRLTTPTCRVLVLGNVMWSDKKVGTAGLYFEFNSDLDREAWFEGLVEALLSSHALY